jgi:hypothetical protein
VKAKPARVTLTDGFVSNTPPEDLVDVRGANSIPAEEARERLEAIHAAREPITIVTTLRIYENMIMESLSVTRTAKDVESLHFKATFREIKFVTNERTTIRVAVPSDGKKKNLGAKEAVQKAIDFFNGIAFQGNIKKLEEDSKKSIPVEKTYLTKADKRGFIEQPSHGGVFVEPPKNDDELKKLGFVLPP